MGNTGLNPPSPMTARDHKTRHERSARETHEDSAHDVYVEEPRRDQHAGNADQAGYDAVDNDDDWLDDISSAWNWQ